MAAAIKHQEPLQENTDTVAASGILDTPPKAKRSPGYRISREELARRVAATAKMLARKHLRPEIYSMLRRMFNPKMAERTCDLYISRARQLLAERYFQEHESLPKMGTGEYNYKEVSEKAKEYHRLEAFSLYESIVRNSKSSPAELMAAQAAINKLLGLDAPAKIALTSPDGEREALLNFRQGSLAIDQGREMLALMAERLLPKASLEEGLEGGVQD